jgi:hypothetical protein
MIGVMNNTKWEELRLAMYALGSLHPRFRVKIIVTGHISEWDGEWYHHFRDGGYDDLEWVEIRTPDLAQREAVRTCLREIHVPGEEFAEGFRVVGWIEPGASVGYIE